MKNRKKREICQKLFQLYAAFNPDTQIGTHVEMAHVSLKYLSFSTILTVAYGQS